jgi:hypothetical protein
MDRFEDLGRDGSHTKTDFKKIGGGSAREREVSYLAEWRRTDQEWVYSTE